MGLRERVAAGRRETPFRGTAHLPNQYRTSCGPGWALVGDAGHHKDPSTGMGMSAQPEQTSRVLGALGGSLPFEDVYSRRHILAALS